jgi:ParB family chromosome partitioning protein
MAFNITDILNSKTRGSMTEGYLPIKLSVDDIIITKHNKYSMDEINELATGIHMAGALQQPLVVGKVGEEYWLVSGHRRHAAIKLLLAEGEEQFKEIECRYKEMTETEFRMELLIGNTFNRKQTDHDKMIEAQEWKELLEQMKKDGSFKPEKGTRTRDYIAAIMGEATGTIGMYQQIANNATDAIKEQFAAGNMNMTAAAEASKLEEDKQNAIAQAAADGQETRAAEIRAMAEERQQAKEKADEDEETDEEEHSKQTLEQMKESVSDTDTTEEERKNARRLHALKMLEKYYIYMSEEEVGILERMLEDCKRRKREYGLDDVGSTI